MHQRINMSISDPNFYIVSKFNFSKLSFSYEDAIYNNLFFFVSFFKEYKVNVLACLSFNYRSCFFKQDSHGGFN